MKFNLFDELKRTNSYLIKLSRYIPLFNRQENEILTQELRARFRALQEQNSQDLYTFYYVPNAVRNLVKNKKLLTNENIKSTATLLFLKDVAEGKIDEFNWFKEEGV